MPDVRTVDVAVVGAGPAGLSAAVRAAGGGARVLVLDQSSHLGGQIWRHRERATLAGPARAWLARFEAAGAGYLPQATVADASPGRLFAVTPAGPVTIHARSIVLATGARELFLPFPGWTLPNVFGVGGLQALIKSGLDVRGKRVVIAGSGPLVFPVAATAAEHGAQVVAVCEQAPRGAVLAFGAGLWRAPSKLVAALRYRSAFRSAAFSTGTWVARADGKGRVERVTLTDGRRQRTMDCDLLATACGLIPNVELGAALGCRVVNGALLVDEAQRTSVPSVFAAGECTGVGGEDLALAEGAIAGLAAAGRPWRALRRGRDRARGMVRRMERAFAPRAELLRRAEADTVVCRCEDVRLRDLDAGWDGRQAKLASRAGMGACQGRVCGAALARMYQWAPPGVRAPLSPVPVLALAALDDDVAG